VQPGRHGVYLEAGAARGLLLPQVAAHRGWSAVQFLEAVSQKAELKSSAWRDRQVRLSVFEAQVFSRQSL